MIAHVTIAGPAGRAMATRQLFSVQVTLMHTPLPKPPPPHSHLRRYYYHHLPLSPRSSRGGPRSSQPEHHGGGPIIYAWHPDASYMASVGPSRVVHVWDRYGKILSRVPPSDSAVHMPARARAAIPCRGPHGARVLSPLPVECRVAVGAAK